LGVPEKKKQNQRRGDTIELLGEEMKSERTTKEDRADHIKTEQHVFERIIDRYS
jgi:hypothetical protein